MTHNDTQWHTMTHYDTQWHTMTDNDTQWHTVTHSGSGSRCAVKGTKFGALGALGFIVVT